MKIFTLEDGMKGESHHQHEAAEGGVLVLMMMMVVLVVVVRLVVVVVRLVVVGVVVDCLVPGWGGADVGQGEETVSVDQTGRVGEDSRALQPGVAGVHLAALPPHCRD